jgi:hypothetical protein
MRNDGNALFTSGFPYNPSFHGDPRSALRSFATSSYKPIPNRLLFQKPISLAVNPFRLVTGLLAGVNALMLEFQDEITSIASELTNTVTSVGKGVDVDVSGIGVLVGGISVLVGGIGVVVSVG